MITSTTTFHWVRLREGRYSFELARKHSRRQKVTKRTKFAETPQSQPKRHVLGDLDLCFASKTLETAAAWAARQERGRGLVPLPSAPGE
ncbi:hypothetical protein V5799_029413 [Amblyomma americanum]|uniref:Uncharacterized protein n=1 Tax=Amblyomma americanum TaxID=6943 RepID=A0AAQ4ERV3_AMBAM